MTEPGVLHAAATWLHPQTLMQIHPPSTAGLDGVAAEKIVRGHARRLLVQSH